MATCPKCLNKCRRHGNGLHTCKRHGVIPGPYNLDHRGEPASKGHVHFGPPEFVEYDFNGMKPLQAKPSIEKRITA